MLIRASVATAVFFVAGTGIAHAVPTDVIHQPEQSIEQHFEGREIEKVFLSEGTYCKVVGFRDNGYSAEFIPEHTKTIIAEKTETHEVLADIVVPEEIRVIDNGVVVFLSCHS